MTIYKKIAEIQTKMMGVKFPTKKGFRGNYIPLPELLPPIQKACFEKELTLYFTSTNEQLILKLMSWGGKQEFSCRVRLPELHGNEQQEGKNITYLKRYLLMNVFLIIEDSVDSEDLAPETDVKTGPSMAKHDGIHPLITEALDQINKKGITDFDHTVVRNYIRGYAKLQPADKKEINQYLLKAYPKNNKKVEAQ